MDISEQLKLIRNKQGLSQQAFAHALGVSTATIASVENGSRDMPKNLMKLLVKKVKINANWLLTGEGEMFVQDGKETTALAGEAALIPVLSQKVSCGPGQSWESEQNIVEYLDVKSLSPALQAKDVYGFRASGTSMIGAGIRDGDIVLFNASGSLPLSDGIYVFGLDGDAYCKRLEFDSLANRIKIYSVRVADLEKAELLRTLDSTDEGFAERFQLFGKVFSWIHVIRDGAV